MAGGHGAGTPTSAQRDGREDGDNRRQEIRRVMLGHDVLNVDRAGGDQLSGIELYRKPCAVEAPSTPADV